MVGTRFILNSRYFHIAKPGEKLSDHALSGEHAANLVRYCGTRETVDKNIDMADDLPITFKQKVSVKDLLNLCTEKGLSAECEEYKAYEANPTRANASSLMLHLANKLSENTSLNLSEQNIVNEAIRLAQFYDVKNRPATKKQKETIKEFLEQLKKMMRINRWNTPIILIIRLCQMLLTLYQDLRKNYCSTKQEI